MSDVTGTSGGLSIAVCVKFNPDVNELRADAAGRPDLAHVPWRTNEFDRNALEEALRLKERHGGRIVAVSLVEREPSRDVLLRALAAGADALYLVPHPAAVAGDAFATATVLAAALEEIAAVYEMCSWDLVLCGDAATDTYDGQVGPRVAEALGLVPITCVTRVEVDGGAIRADRLLEDGVHVVEASLPALLSVGPETNHPRLPHLMQIMGAGQKPIVVLRSADLARNELSLTRPALEMLEITAPSTARRRMVIKGDDPADVARRLVRRMQAAGEVTL